MSSIAATVTSMVATSVIASPPVRAEPRGSITVETRERTRTHRPSARKSRSDDGTYCPTVIDGCEAATAKKGVPVATTSVDRLRDRVRGEVVTSDDAEYDSARKVYNAMIDRRPHVVIRCLGTEDVVAAVDYARANQLAVAVRGGGHSVPGFGTADDAVVVELSGMRQVAVDDEARLARVKGGATWGVFNEAAHRYGLATTGGVISTTGVGGLTLGGGIGYLARGAGFSCDNLASAEVVTADGRTVRASESENADLFWAIRGGGGNFGVVTEFEFRLHP